MKKILSLVTVLALAVPAAAIAAKPADPGSNGKGKVQRCKKSNKVAFTVGGTVVDPAAAAADTSTAEYLTVTGEGGPVTFKVEKANKHARKWLAADEGNTAELDAAKITLAEGNTAIEAGDKVKALGKTGQKRNCTATKAVSLRKVTVSQPEPAEEAPAPTTTA